MVERVKEYVQTLSVKDKEGYEKRITACVEYLDSIGVTEPTEQDWQLCLEHLQADGKLSERTAKTNYIGQAKNFYRRYVKQDSQPRFDNTITDEATKDISGGEIPDNEVITTTSLSNEKEPDRTEETQSKLELEANETPPKKAKEKSVRINFLLDEKRYKKLAILSVLEDTSLTALLKEGIDLCISAHDKQAEIAEQAISRSENARSE